MIETPFLSTPIETLFANTTFFRSPPVKPKARYLSPKTNSSITLDQNKKDLHISDASPAGRIYELSIGDHSLQLVIDSRPHEDPVKLRYRATLWVDKNKIKDIFTLQNSESLPSTTFNILGIDNIETFVKNIVSPPNPKKRLSSSFYKEADETCDSPKRIRPNEGMRLALTSI